ncbi:MAG: alkaline phosphatase family protein, partial [bacterium]
PKAISRALAIAPHHRTGTIADVEHVVILMQENRSFDHYFGTLNGVRGFGDRFPIPVPDAPGRQRRTVWFQSGSATEPGPAVVAPFHLNTQQSFEVMRVTGTPHRWPDAQGAWDDGRIHQWPHFKTNHAMGFFNRDDIPFQFAMAEAFTLCDAYHCSFQGGTNPNRLFQWSGTNDPLALGHGPALTNDFDNLDHDPAGGYTWVTYAERLEALTANPRIWSKTVLFVNFDENDGFFDHVPPPAPPSILSAAPRQLAGASTVDTTGEYHEIQPPDIDPTRTVPLHKPYGLGPRVPMYVISPWSKGGWVNSQVFDHTSVLRFLERRFGVAEPNISPWRRAVCGDLTSALDFTDPDNRRFLDELPDPTQLAARARALPDTTTPPTPTTPALPEQEMCARPSRALPYELHVTATVSRHREPHRIDLAFTNTGGAGAVFHVYDRKHLDRIPRRYTVEPDKRILDRWDLADDAGDYDLWLIAPNGFHRHFTGRAGAHPAAVEVDLAYARGDLTIT